MVLTFNILKKLTRTHQNCSFFFILPTLYSFEDVQNVLSFNFFIKFITIFISSPYKYRLHINTYLRC